MPGLNVFLFGMPRVERDGAAVAVERRKTLALLTYLAVTRQPHGRDALATLLWPDLDGEHGRAALRRTLVEFNAAFGKGWVEVEGDQIALRAEPGLQVDVAQFHAALAQVASHSHPPYRLCDACLAHLTEAASLYTADFLAGFTLEDAAGFDDWQTFQTESLRLELAGALERLAQGLAGRRQWEVAIGQARRWLALDPLHEPAHRLLMQLHAWAGDRAAAARQYQECVKVMQAELGIEPEMETTALLAAIRSGTVGEVDPAHPFALSPTPTHNLPSDPTPFIGRERELAQIAARLADPACRLLTIVGPGGMGKTRLVIQAARSQTDVFAHGVFLVDLSPVTSSELLAAAILQALPVTAQASADVQTHLLHHLRDKHLLLILDNFEHLVEGGAELLPKLLAGAPRLKLLVTSRLRLNLREEWLAPLEGMQTPPERDGRDHPASGLGGSNPSPDTEKPPQRPNLTPATEGGPSGKGASQLQSGDFQSLVHYSATALFLACVRRLRPGFQPIDNDARQIAHICRLLDGMPLAIELAAARIHSLSLEKLARELEHGLQLLSTSVRDVPQRHRSMTAAFDHSWRLLNPRQQSILRQLSVFRGSCTGEAAEVVTGATVDDLQELADASWLRLEEKGRCGLHELTRQYCSEKLEAMQLTQSGETPDQVRDRHAAYYRALLAELEIQIYQRRGIWVEITPEMNNWLVALDWFVEHDDLDGVWAMIGRLRTLDLASWLRSVLQAYESALCRLCMPERMAADTPDRRHYRLAVRVALLILAGQLNGLLGQAKSGQACQDEAAVLLHGEDACGHRSAELLWLLRYQEAHWRFNQGDFVESVRLYPALAADLGEGRIRLTLRGDSTEQAYLVELYSCLGINLLSLGQYEEARRLGERTLALTEEMDYEFGKSYAATPLGHAAVFMGRFEEAEKWFLLRLKVSRDYRSDTGVAGACLALGMLYRDWGRFDRARLCAARVGACP
jgi:predicted ATPase/DNA-binding SARP family transcriptional activator